MKVLIIGYGSIGRRHLDVLSTFEDIKQIDIVTKQKIENYQCYKSLEYVENIEAYNYFVIASETFKHYEQLKYLEENISNKVIFCEKPLFMRNENLLIKKNKVFVGYNLRFHPLMRKLIDLSKMDKLISANIYCGSYLPNWRKDVDYRKSYSSKREEGGGVLLDLSHEIDYLLLFCGNIDLKKSIQDKISDLEINSDDITTFLGRTDDGAVVNLNINYFSKITTRTIVLNYLNKSYQLDLIANTLKIGDREGNIETLVNNNYHRNLIFKDMHEDILYHGNLACSYQEGIKVMELIEQIQGQNCE